MQVCHRKGVVHNGFVVLETRVGYKVGQTIPDRIFKQCMGRYRPLAHFTPQITHLTANVSLPPSWCFLCAEAEATAEAIEGLPAHL